MTSILAQVDVANITMAATSVLALVGSAIAIWYSRRANFYSMSSAISAKRSADAAVVSAEVAKQGLQLQVHSLAIKLAVSFELKEVTFPPKYERFVPILYWYQVDIVNEGQLIYLDDVYFSRKNQPHIFVNASELPNQAASNRTDKIEARDRWTGYSTTSESEPYGAAMLAIEALHVSTKCGGYSATFNVDPKDKAKIRDIEERNAAKGFGTHRKPL